MQCRKLAQVLTPEEPINLKYIKDLQTKDGSFGPGFPLAIDGQGSIRGNENTLLLKCIANDDFECDRTFLENLRHIALGAAVERAEKVGSAFLWPQRNADIEAGREG